MSSEIKFNDLSKQWSCIENTALPKIVELLRSGGYIQGPLVQEFEQRFAKYVGSKYAVATSNGTDALKLSIQALGLSGNINVVMQSNAFIADTLAVDQQIEGRYTISMVDCNKYYQIDCDLLEAYLSKNRDKYDESIILVVHLYGHPANMKRIQSIAKKYNCFILEDAAQAHGAECFGKHVGNFSDICAYSLYPGKNLGAAGDAGIITFNNQKYENKLRSLRNLGSIKKYHHQDLGWNHRMDPIQALVLLEKLPYLDKWTQAKNLITAKYNDGLKDFDYINLPKIADYVDQHGHHLYVIRILSNNRDDFVLHMKNKNIPVIIHYPVPVQKSKPYKYLDNITDSPLTIKFSDELVSLPLHPFLSDEEVETIIEAVRMFVPRL